MKSFSLSRRGLRSPSVLLGVFLLAPGLRVSAGEAPAGAAAVESAVSSFRLADVRLIGEGPFIAAVEANRRYLLELNADRLLAPFRREAGLPPKAEAYGNWESSGLDGHTLGHYLSALAHMLASGADTPDGALRTRLNYVLSELEACQARNGDGYLGGVPGSRELWKTVAAGEPRAIGKKWVPWYNVHKTFAGLRDVYFELGDEKAKVLFVRLGEWCLAVTSGLSDAQMQQMLEVEHGGMNEVLADLYAVTGDKKFLAGARRFCHHAVLDPLEAQQDKLTGKHANTQIPKVIGLERISALAGDAAAHAGARFFWENVVHQRSVAFGGNSVSEHFNDPKDFHGMLVHREGPETCNTYNMLRLTELLFQAEPKAAYADFYERALYNHILPSLNPKHPGFVYFTPIRPGHYRVYSEVDNSFWCCVGTGLENPGRYGAFIYAKASEGIYLNLYIASELTDSSRGLVLVQDTQFPEEECSRVTLRLREPKTFTLHLRVPGWVQGGAFSVKVNGKSLASVARPSSFLSLKREWKDGDRLEIALPMSTRVEQLPDHSSWYAFLRGPIVLVASSGTWEMTGLRADNSRMAHVAAGPVLPLHKAPVLLPDGKPLEGHVKADTGAGPLHFRLTEIVEPAVDGGVPLLPFYQLHDSRYQMYWESATLGDLAARKKQLEREERARLARDAATVDLVVAGEQQPETEHEFQGRNTESGLHNGRHWRHGSEFQYTLNSRNKKDLSVMVTYSGDDAGRSFDIFANEVLIATQTLTGEKRGDFVDKFYPLPSAVFEKARDGRVLIRFAAKKGLAGGVYEVRLLQSLRPDAEQK